jgi:hypothetical protein
MSMTSTTLRNVDFSNEIMSFNLPERLPPVNLARTLYHFLQLKGPLFLLTNPGKALLHALNKAAHGTDYRIDGKKEQQRLENEMPSLHRDVEEQPQLVTDK